MSVRSSVQISSISIGSVSVHISRQLVTHQLRGGQWYRNIGTETIRPVPNTDGTGRIGTKMLSRTDTDTECKNSVRFGFVSFNTEWYRTVPNFKSHMIKPLFLGYGVLRFM